MIALGMIIGVVIWGVAILILWICFRLWQINRENRKLDKDWKEGRRS